MVVRDERDVSYRRIAKLPTLMPIPMSGSLVIRQNSTHYAVFSMRGTDVRYEMVNGDDSQAGSVAVVQADGVRPAVLFDDNRLSVIVTGMHGLADSATLVRQGQVLLSVDARFLSTEWPVDSSVAWPASWHRFYGISGWFTADVPTGRLRTS